ncbi:MAG: DUF6152 family protein [Pseudohongiellaceae bacterium]|jgi:hypothetical protein
MNARTSLLLALLLSAGAAPVNAHHSFYAEFDQNKQVTLEGTVVKMEWVNPHSWLHLEVTNAKGEKEVWKVEGGSPAVLLRLGWTRDSIPPGIRVKVVGFQAKDGALRANSRSVEFPDGRSMELGSSNREEGRPPAR